MEILICRYRSVEAIHPAGCDALLNITIYSMWAKYLLEVQMFTISLLLTWNCARRLQTIQVYESRGKTEKKMPMWVCQNLPRDKIQWEKDKTG